MPSNADEAGLQRLAEQLRSGKVSVKLFLPKSGDRFPGTRHAPNSRAAPEASETGSGFAGSEPGAGRARVTVLLFLSTVIVRESTERKIHPETASPTRRRTRVFVVRSSTTATFMGVPIAVPTSVRSGCSGSAGLGGGRAAATRWATTGGMGGRRDAEKIGRSRVASSAPMEIPHSGLPPGGGCRAPASLGAVGGCSVFGLVCTAAFF